MVLWCMVTTPSLRQPDGTSPDCLSAQELCMHRSRLRKDHNPQPEHDQPVTKPDKKELSGNVAGFHMKNLLVRI